MQQHSTAAIGQSNSFQIAGLLTVKDVVALTRLSRVTIYRAVRGGKFPPPVRVNSRQIRFRATDVENWVNGLQAHRY